MSAALSLHDDPHYQRGAACYQRGEFFEAHEHWEDLWKTLSGDKRLLVQGLIQVAAAWVKRHDHAPVGARKLLSSALQRLDSLPSPLWGADVARFRAAVERCRDGALAWERGDEDELPEALLPPLP